MKTSPLAGIAASAMLAFLLPVRAQTLPPSTPADSSVVTMTPFDVSSTTNQGYRATNSISGTRTNMALIDLPQTVDVMTSDFMSDLDVSNIDDALRYVSSVTDDMFQPGDYSVRGFNIGPPLRNGNQAAVSTVDMTIDPAFIDRVEVVKGPASAMYGVGTPGGIINFVTKQPLDHPATEIDAQVDSLGGIRGVIDNTGPTSFSNLDYRIIAVGQKQYSTVGEGALRESFEVSPILRWYLGRDTSTPTVVTVTLDWLDVPRLIHADQRYPQLVEEAPAPTPANPNAQALEAVGYIPGLPPRFDTDGPNAGRQDDNQYFEVDVTHVFSPHLSSRVTYSEDNLEHNRTGQFVAGNITLTSAGTIPSVINVDDWHVLDDTWSQQIRADLNFDYDFPWAKVNLVVGGQYVRSSLHQIEWENLNHTTFHLFDPGPADWDLGTFPEDYTEFYNDLTVSDSSVYNAVSSIRLLHDRLNVVGGFSRSYEIKADLFPVAFPGVTGGTASSKEQVTPFAFFDEYQAGLTFRVLQGVNLFYDYSESAQSNGVLFPDQPQAGHGGEAGVRTDLFGGRISGSVSYFNTILSNIPESNPNVPSNPVFLSGQQQSKGIETDLFIFPTDNWQIVLNYTNMRPIIVSNTSAPWTQGNTIDDAYPREFNGFTKYTFKSGPLDGFYVTLGVNFRSASKPFGSISNLYLLTNPAYTVWNPGLGYSWTSGPNHWRAGVMIDNVFDRGYFVNTGKAGEGRIALFTLTLKR